MAIDREPTIAANCKLAHRPSLLQDVQAGRQMEVDALYAVPLDIARMMGVATPMLDLLAGLIRAKARERGLYLVVQPDWNSLAD